MSRNELLKSVGYWTQMLQIDVFEMVDKYLSDNKMTKAQFAEKLGVSKGYVSQIFKGDFDHRVSKLVELALACDRVPTLSFAPIEKAEEIVCNYHTKPAKWLPEEKYVELPQTLSLRKVECIYSTFDYFPSGNNNCQSVA